jgi:hypothetical protein
VTYAAHYPVGYPAFVGALYWLFGPHPLAAMIGNALVGSLAVIAAHRIAARGGSRKIALVAASLVAVHPGLVSYTPALMTEGMTAALVTVAMWLAIRASEKPSFARLGATGIVIALAAFVRPQSLALTVLLPLALVPPASSISRRLLRAGAASLALVLACAVVIAPWTERNCRRMGQCAVVSVNDGWNLLIGTDPEAHGTWAPLKVPEDCRDVFDEAEKNRCFGVAAKREIARSPLQWLALTPAKLGATFNYAGAGPWYLHQSNPDALTDRGKTVLGGLEVLFERLTVLAALVAVARRFDPRGALVDRLGLGLVLLSIAASFVPSVGYVAVLGLVLALGLLVFRRATDLPPVFPLAFVHVGSTMVIHAIFFGAGRYSLVVFPVVCALAAFARLARKSVSLP